MNKLQPILDKYDEKCAQPSDIHELLPYLYQYAKECEHITEMGVRNPTSTYAFLAANPKKLISYDISRWEAVDEAEKLAKECGVNFEFIQQDVLKADIEETDFLFIDTFHTATQLERELARHSGKVRKYIGFHDTETYFINGEIPYEGIPADVACGRGLKFALEPFLMQGTFRVIFKIPTNNGLTIIERCAV
jgi:hypothetical protein